uniref:Uncharacterized protein n=1 Tax=Rhizophora mucronata TaxID=61149 RepID=A0A2P2J1Z7_RHIMU
MALPVSFKLCFSCFCSTYHQQSLNPTKKKLRDPTKFFCKSSILLSSRRLSGYSPSQASNSPGEEASESSTINESLGVYLVSSYFSLHLFLCYV